MVLEGDFAYKKVKDIVERGEIDFRGVFERFTGNGEKMGEKAVFWCFSVKIR